MFIVYIESFTEMEMKWESLNNMPNSNNNLGLKNNSPGARESMFHLNSTSCKLFDRTDNKLNNKLFIYFLALTHYTTNTVQFLFKLKVDFTLRF